MIFLHKYTDTDIAGSSLKTLMLNTISLSRLTLSTVNILWHISPTKAHNSKQAGHFFPRIQDYMYLSSHVMLILPLRKEILISKLSDIYVPFKLTAGIHFLTYQKFLRFFLSIKVGTMVQNESIQNPLKIIFTSL